MINTLLLNVCFFLNKCIKQHLHFTTTTTTHLLSRFVEGISLHLLLLLQEFPPDSISMIPSSPTNSIAYLHITSCSEELECREMT